MRRRLVCWLGLVAAAAALATGAAPASAAPTAEVVQGQIIRIVSVADWADAGSLLPGETVRWDLAVSADAPEPGDMFIGVSATGSVALTMDASMCLQEWQGERCPGGAVVLRTGWQVPMGDVATDLAEIDSEDVAHLRLDVGLAADVDGGSTSLRLHVRGQGEQVSVGPGDDTLAGTGMSSVHPWVIAGAVLLVSGVVLATARGRSRAIVDAPARGGDG